MARLRSLSSFRLTQIAIACLLATMACNANDPAASPQANDAGVGTVTKTAATARAKRRAYDGAPPVIPHGAMGAECTSCHTRTGIQFGSMGFAPPMPHVSDPGGIGQFARCTQCHVYQNATTVFVENTFDGLRQDLRHGKKQHALAPPVIPHSTFMRENCVACHTGPAAREEIRCSHPERIRCGQCHVAAVTSDVFARTADAP